MLLLLLLGALFVGLRGIHALAEQPQESAIRLQEAPPSRVRKACRHVPA